MIGKLLRIVTNARGRGGLRLQGHFGMAILT